MLKERILIISNAYPSEAKPFAGIFVKNQVKELESRGNYSVFTFALQREFTGFVGSIVKYSKAYMRFIPLLFKRYDLVHLHFFFPLIWTVVLYKLFWSKSQVVVTFHGSDIHQRFRGVFSNMIHKYALSRVNFIHCVGHDLADELLSTLDRKADLIMPVGIDKSVFKVEKVVSQEKEYDFIFVGSFTKRKGVDLILDAIAMLSRKGLSYCFIGSGPEEHLIRQCAGSHEITIFKDLTQGAIAKKMNQSRFLLLPSRYEPFGLVVTEALYCGVPCIVSKIGGLKEQIEDSVNGLLVDSLYGHSVASVMRRAIRMTEDEYSTMSERAANSNDCYSMERVVDQLEEIYSTLIACNIE